MVHVCVVGDTKVCNNTQFFQNNMKLDGRDCGEVHPQILISIGESPLRKKHVSGTTLREVIHILFTCVYSSKMEY